jgi:hypothetical protein
MHVYTIVVTFPSKNYCEVVEIILPEYIQPHEYRKMCATKNVREASALLQ